MSKRIQQREANKALREQLARQERRRRTILVSALAAAAVLLAGAIGYGIYLTQRPKDFPVPATATPDHAGLVVGDGPITVDLYIDYLCPHCKDFEKRAQPKLDKYVADKRIRLVYHPLNILDAATSTHYSTRAASAAGCAADGGKLVAYSAALFARQPAEGGPGLPDSQLVEIGNSVGLTAPEFATCVDDEKYGDWVSFVTEKADERDVRSTPAVFVSGKKVSAKTIEELVTNVSAAIDGA